MRGIVVLQYGFSRQLEIFQALLANNSDPDRLIYRPDAESNTIAWLCWHMGRTQDNEVAGAFGVPELYAADGWAKRMALPFADTATGYNQTSEEVGQVVVPAQLLGDYYAAVAQRSTELLAAVTDEELERIVDTSWNPPITLGVRLFSVIEDTLQHLGQVGYVQGLAERAGR